MRRPHNLQPARHRRPVQRRLPVVFLVAVGLALLGGLILARVDAPVLSQAGESATSGSQRADGAPGEAPSSGASWRGRRGIYLTSQLAANPERLERSIERVTQSGLDTLVVDVKDKHGVVAYPTDVAQAEAMGARRPRLDLTGLVERVHKSGLYLIARQVVFHDPQLAEHRGSPMRPWVDPEAREVVDYNLAIARDVAEAGVDEIQFDYVRYPDEGPYKAIYADRYEAITQFVARARDVLEGTVHVSADVFGRTLRPWNERRVDPIGQDLGALMPHVEVLSPMVYPSHYESDAYRHAPYETVRNELATGLDRGLTMRPFLQAFEQNRPPDMSQAAYIRAQIRAVRDLPIPGYLFWEPHGDYEALWRALDEP